MLEDVAVIWVVIKPLHSLEINTFGESKIGPCKNLRVVRSLSNLPRVKRKTADYVNH